MSIGREFDFAVFGATPLAQLLAGLLAVAYGLKVCMVGVPPHPARPLRGFDLSVGPISRPQHWRLLRTATQETTRLLNRTGVRHGIERVDPVFTASSRRSADFLGHVRFVAEGYGYAIERQVRGSVASHCRTYQFKDALWIARRRVQPKLGEWLARSGVTMLDLEKNAIALRRDGTVHIGNGEGSAKAAVLADDDAILKWADRARVADCFGVVPATALLTEPSPPLAHRVLVDLDDALVVHQDESGAIESAGRGEEPAMERGLVRAFEPHYRSVLAGRSSFATLETRDGAPAFGPLPGTQTIVIANFGMTGLFLATAMARALASASTDEEAEFFAAHRPVRAAFRDIVADGLAERRT